MTHNSDLSSEQLDELTQIFRAESVEHVKRLAELLFQMEESGATQERLTDAFRQAHNLKGSAALLGFERVARLTHRLEDVLGVLRRGEQTLTTPTMDLILGTLDIVRKAVDSSQPGDDVLTADEQSALTTLNHWLDHEPPADETTPEPQPPPAVNAQEPSTSAADSTSQQPPLQGEPGAEQDTFIRVTADGLNSLTAQVDDLFEAQVQVEGFSREVVRLQQGVEQLRTAVQKIRSETPSADATEADELADLLQVRLDAAAGQFDRNMQGLSNRIRQAQREVGHMGLAGLDSLSIKLRRQVRAVSQATDKQVELHFEGGEYAVDRRVLEALTEPLVHLIRNAVDHGIEPEQERLAAGKPAAGQLQVRARHMGDAVELSLSDDGRGIDLEAVRHTLIEQGQSAETVHELGDAQLVDRLFESGFSTHRQVSEVSGRGVGLDVVKHTMDRVGGEVRLETRAGRGTTIALRLPLSMSTVRCLLVTVGGRILALPAANAQKVLILRPADVLDLGQGEVVEHADAHIPITSLHTLLGKAPPQWAPDATRKTVVLKFGDRRWALYVDDVLEYTEIIVKPLGDLLERVPTVSGIALLSDGELALVLNPGDLVRAAGSRVLPSGRADSAADDTQTPQVQQVVLVVDDSIATRALERSLLESAGYRVLTATDGYNALEVLASRHCDLVITDAQMPHMDGFELTRTLKSRAPLAHLPVIMITSLGTPEDIELGMASGADAYVVKKNLTQHELVSTINQLL